MDVIFHLRHNNYSWESSEYAYDWRYWNRILANEKIPFRVLEISIFFETLLLKVNRLGEKCILDWLSKPQNL